MNSNNNFIGSQWHIWDLHVHSPASYGGEYDDFIQNLESCRAHVIGINDYCTLDGYKTVVESGKIKSKVLFPVIEFRMNNILLDKNTPKGKQGTKLNFHIIFDNASELLMPITNWLNSIDCKYGQGKNDKLGDVPENDRPQISLDFFEVVDSLKKHAKLAEKYLVWVPYDEYGGIDRVHPEEDKYFKMGIIQNTDILGSSNLKQRKFFLWEHSKYSEEQISSWLNGRRIPCIKGSDAHKVNYPFGKLKDKKSKPIEKYCWIKAELTFEGLRQILFEPKYRIHIGKNPPSDPLYGIDGVRLNFHSSATIHNDTFCFAGKHDLAFSPNLTCLIGGRGVGKSTLLNLVCKSLAIDIGESHIDRIDLPNENNVNDCITVDGAGRQKYVEYLQQNQIEEFATDSEAFTEAIFRRMSNLDEESMLSKRGDILQHQVHTISVVVDEILNREETRSEISRLEAELSSVENVISSIQSDEYKTLTQTHTACLNNLREIKISKSRYDGLVQRLHEVLDDYEYISGDDINEYDTAHNKLVESFNRFLHESSKCDFQSIEQTQDHLKKNSERLKEEIRTYCQSKNLSDEDLNDISGAAEQQSELKEELRIQRESERLLTKAIEKFDEEKILNTKSEYEAEIKKHIKPISESLQGLGKDVKPISLQYRFDEMEAKNNLLEYFLNVFGSSLGEKLGRIREDYLQRYLFSINPAEVKGYNTFISSLTRDEDLGDSKTRDALLVIFSKEVNFEIYKLLILRAYSDANKYKRIDVLYGQKPLSQSSFGERCAATIIVMLSLGNNPIIIDEPEAHLDSALIANYLVNVVKEKKQHRQIIFATHNANFVVNGDAELIQILEMTNENITKIIATSIENLEHREKLLKLEGGKEAFAQRGEKYALTG